MQLHVNIDHVATIRQSRGTSYPDPVWAAALCELAGADGITVHLREDRRHIQERDVFILRQTVRTLLNLEMAATPAMVALACQLHPEIATLVPEKREERTTEGGLDVTGDGARAQLRGAVTELGRAGIEVSLFIDPEAASVRAAAVLGAPRIELHTGYYCDARGERAEDELRRLVEAAAAGVSLGLHVAAGHGLDYPNVGRVAALPGIDEMNIGHALVARAVFVGLRRAVREMRQAIEAGEARRLPRPRSAP
jgi:pyridoxine 5-phosphate synthase